MSLALLFPLGLLALIAGVVPLLIHLARRQVHAPLDFAALRWLRAKVRPRQRIRFDEWPLLLVRLLLLAALALLLARPVLRGGAPDTHAVVAVAPGLELTALRAQQPDADWRWLAPGFASVDSPMPARAQPLSSLLRELDQQLPVGTPLTVYVPDPLRGADAQRPQLSRRVQWQPIALAPAAVDPAAAAAPRLRPGMPMELQAQRVLTAIQQAWSGQPLAAATDTAPAPGEIGVWLAAAPLPGAWQAWLAQGGTLISTLPAAQGSAETVVLRDAQGDAVVSERRIGNGRLLRLHAALSPATLPILQDADFPRQLLARVQPAGAPQRVAARAHVPLAGAAAPRPQPRDLAPWLLGLIVLLFAPERWLATAPRRGVPA